MKAKEYHTGIMEFFYFNGLANLKNNKFMKKMQRHSFDTLRKLIKATKDMVLFELYQE